MAAGFREAAIIPLREAVSPGAIAPGLPDFGGYAGVAVASASCLR